MEKTLKNYLADFNSYADNCISQQINYLDSNYNPSDRDFNTLDDYDKKQLILLYTISKLHSTPFLEDLPILSSLVQYCDSGQASDDPELENILNSFIKTHYNHVSSLYDNRPNQIGEDNFDYNDICYGKRA
tara:strand:+ start:277 stop:669 length:393 start_codon:yes stop_codon:yes gene_type:complete